MTLDDICRRHNVRTPWQECGDGWLPIIDRLMERLLELGWDRNVTTIKEKWGGLRFYIGAHPDGAAEAINSAEAESFKTCEVCGSPGALRGGGWLKTLCNEHAKGRPVVD